MNWKKDTAIPYRQFAYVNNVAIGYIKPHPAAAEETWEWGLTAIGLLVGIECKGECRTVKGAKTAMARNWQRSLEKLGLILEKDRYLRDPSSYDRTPKPHVLTHENVISFHK